MKFIILSQVSGDSIVGEWYVNKMANWNDRLQGKKCHRAVQQKITLVSCH